MHSDNILADDTAPNPPGAKGMAVIGWLCHNVVVGCLMGSFSVMLASVETRMHVTRALSSSVGAVVMFGSALMGAVAGPLLGRYSLRLMLTLGAVLSLAGYLLLAFTTSYPVYFGSYLLLFGPSMAITGSVGPATLVTRWFSRNRGVALGLVHVNLVVAAMPLICNAVLEQYGARTVYLMLAGIVAIALVPATLMVRNFPQGTAAQAEAAEAAAETGLPTEDTLTVGQIVRKPVFWAIALTACAIIAGIMTMTLNMMPVAQSLGFTRTQGALMSTSQSVVGMVGSLLFGWVADRIGGARGLALLACNMALLLLAMQIPHLPFPVMMALVGLFGLHGAGMIPNASRALAHSLGRGSFSRAFGLQSAMSVPMTMAGIVAMGAAYTRIGSYTPALMGVALLMAVMVPLVLTVGRTKPAE